MMKSETFKSLSALLLLQSKTCREAFEIMRGIFFRKMDAKITNSPLKFIKDVFITCLDLKI